MISLILSLHNMQQYPYRNQEKKVLSNFSFFVIYLKKNSTTEESSLWAGSQEDTHLVIVYKSFLLSEFGNHQFLDGCLVIFSCMWLTFNIRLASWKALHEICICSRFHSFKKKKTVINNDFLALPAVRYQPEQSDTVS